ncbi:hypothetical protein B6P73_22415, partial [Escherichia coli]|nr:hypothetical protein [Escherichia coli]
AISCNRTFPYTAIHLNLNHFFRELRKYYACFPCHSSRLFLITRLMIPSILAHFSQNGGKFFQQMLNQHWVYPVHSTLYLSLDICGRKDAWFIT